MSMNLIWSIKIKGNGKERIRREEFPYQTSTDVTYKVLEASTTEEILNIIKEDIKNWDDERKEDCLSEIKDKLEFGYNLDMI